MRILVLLLLVNILSAQSIVITLESAQFASGQEVGNDISIEYKINGSTFGLSESTLVDRDIELECIVVEEDTHYNDVGSIKIEIDFTQLNSYRGSGFRVEVPISEYNGKFEGHTAIWEFIFKVE